MTKQDIKERVSKKGKLIISHGGVEHNINDTDDCITCLDAQIDLLQEYRKAGGRTKFLNKLTKL